ncbi:CYTH and CHAD domain-containing protein [Streptomyces sp. NBC_00335]|uniref:CYTH and CHAD domain-containing protein n=1 Tax=unclassified Streptomyces TaxID=2593676 RepID=UPI002253E5DA|nr:MULTISPECIES: CYTH and CHAD domain-containing protein [unclassified Streptomyces]MCX5407257.1 CYTH and CHAD domain-containing protein [Streptomyces sp. NBC_00086]
MADTKREIERKFEFRSTKAGRRGVPDLTGTAAIAAVTDQGTAELDATYYDTPDQRLAADGLTLRRRTGGKDAGWHLKLPVAPGVRDEITAPLGDTVPDALTALLRSRVRDTPLEPQVRLLSSRKLSHLLDADGALLAELSTDAVRAERADATAAWTEVEVELADGADPALLDAVETVFRKAGLRVSDAPSKLARALTETGGQPPARTAAATGPAEDTVGAHVLAYLREQRDTLIAQDPAVRRGLPDSVHQMRVATRRLRGAFKTYRRILDPAETGPIGEELRWLAAELGVDRDQEVLLERIQTRLDELPRTLVLGPVRGRLKIWNVARRAGSRRAALAALDSRRHVALLNALDALLADPPLLKAAARPAASALPAAVLGDYERLAGRIEGALSMDPGEDRDLALHEARKAAKRTRYAAEAAAPALGKPARKLAKTVKAVQSLLGDHQDGVVARDALRGLAVQAAGAGESSFTWGLLYGREEALADRRERELPQVWAATAGPAAAVRG